MTSPEDTLEFWIQKFRQEGFAEGFAEGRAEVLLDLFEARFGAPPADIVALVQRTRDLAVLREWLRTVVTGSEAEVAAVFHAAMGS